MSRKLALWILKVAVAISGILPVAGAQLPFLKPLQADEIAAARELVEAMKKDPRGPYLRLRWFCADGSVHPPAGSPCRERGGGVQHAEPNDQAEELARQSIYVGTLLQPLSFEEFFDDARDHYRMRSFVLEQYLFGADDGWVLREARYYRGARQIEDEERKGREFLQRILAAPDWTKKHFLLASQLTRAVPHRASGEAGIHRIRDLASELAQLDARFQPLRIKIHSFPSREDLLVVESYLSAEDLTGEIREKLTALWEVLTAEYDPRRFLRNLAPYQSAVDAGLQEDIRRLRTSVGDGDANRAFSEIARLALRLRNEVGKSTDGQKNLLLMDLRQLLLERAFVLAQEIGPGPEEGIARGEELGALTDFVHLASAAGFLSGREHEALVEELRGLGGQTSVSAMDYKKHLNYLSNSLDWAMATVRQDFGPAYSRYILVESKASSFPDSLLRSSILLPLSGRLDRLQGDANQTLGQSHMVFGESVNQGIRGLNPGVAMTRLEILNIQNLDKPLDPDIIYLIPATMPEIGPVAGVLTLDSGNPLSHVQLLARNLGIPNAAVSSALLPRLRPFEGKEVFFAVSPMGLVFLKDSSQLDQRDRELLQGDRLVKQEKIQLDTSRLQLERVDPIPLEELTATDAGIVVGPKAANLGRLAGFFVDKVSRGVALPFGMFYRHVDQPYRSGTTLYQQIQDIVQEMTEMRSAGRSEDEIDEFMFPSLTYIREAISELEWRPEVREAIVTAIRTTFGADLSKGVFVRSDTNVEDLPQFSGAGLNLTVAHRRSLEDILVAIKQVWASPFTERAYLWRKQTVGDLGQIYPSVLLLESVPSDKSGVLITSGLQVGGGDALTVVTGEGIGGVVEGEDAETLLVERSGAVRLLSQGKTSHHRVLAETASGVTLVASSREEYLLQPDELRQLRGVVDRWRERLSASERSEIWDIEFGFVKGKLWLFQIRPFVRYRSSQLHERLAALDSEVSLRGSRQVSLRN